MNIRDPRKYMSTIWDWSILDGCFGRTRIKPTDIDGFTERNGYYLVLETKSPGQSVPQGQRLTFEHMASDGHHTVLIIWGNPGCPQEILVIRQHLSRFHKHADVTLLRKLAMRWYEWADNKPPPPERYDPIDWDHVLDREPHEEVEEMESFRLEDYVPDDILQELEAEGRLF